MKMKIGKFQIKLKHAELSVASVVAGIISWSINQSIFWLIVHYLLGLFYIIYFLISWAFGFVNGGDVFNYYKNLIQ